jgi:CBS domain-containing protein
MLVEDLMTRDAVTVGPKTSLKEAAELLSRHRISGVPVCDESGRVLGVVSEADIVEKQQGFAPPHGGLLDWLFEKADGASAKLSARSAGEAMSSPPLVIDAKANVTQAARLMVERRVNRLPVLREGRLVGIVSRADLVRAFGRSDEEIRSEIEALLLQTLWVDPERLEIGIEQGEVSLAGRVDNRSTAELIAGSVLRVPGVVDVRSDLTWDVDDWARRTSASANRLPHRL